MAALGPPLAVLACAAPGGDPTDRRNILYGMREHDCGPVDPFTVTFPGPFTHHDVVVRGWSVPFLKASMRGEDRIRLILDDRMGVELSTDEAERLLPFLANAISVALGYGAHPREDMDELPPKLPATAPRRFVGVLPPEQAA